MPSSGLTGSGREAWTVLSRRAVFAVPVLDVDVERVRLPDGRELADYYRVRMSDFALVFAVTGEDRVIVLRQYKHGPRRVCLTFPGGAISPGESPIEAAQRELREETGYVSERWSSFGPFVTNANQYCNTAHLFRADGCRRVSEPTSPDVESPELVTYPVSSLLHGDTIAEFVLASHAALLAFATHPRIAAAPVRVR